MPGGVLTMLRAYRLAIELPDGTRRVHVDTYRDSGSAADRAIELFPGARRVVVQRLISFLIGRAAA